MDTLAPRELEAVRAHLAVALDVGDLGAGLALAAELGPWFGLAKVGLELFTATGPAAVTGLTERGVDVMADLKLHDIPNTVGRAAAAAGRHGVRYLTVHAAGGPAMLAAAVDGLASTAPAAGVLAVTVLTSEIDATPSVLAERVQLASAAGCAGVVCAATDLEVVRGQETGLVTVTPGIRLAGSEPGDQARVSTPGAALAAGADILVVGRTVTSTPEPRVAAQAVATEAARALRQTLR